MGRGRLLFKGDDKPKKKTKKSKHEVARGADEQESHPPRNEELESSKPSAAAAAASAASTSAATGPKIQQGKGEIVTSGTVVTGFDTIFTRQINIGDALLVQIPHPGEEEGEGPEEMRIVTMRLSDTSINLSSGFSQNLATPTPFRFIAKPSASKSKSQQQQQSNQQQQQQQQPGKHDDVDGTATAAAGEADHRELVYRERTEHGSYRIRRVQLDQEVTRGTLLEMRAKKKSDKYC